MGAIPPESFSEQEETSLARVFAHTFPQWKLLAQGIMIGGLCAILGTLHSMIWSVGVLLLDVVKLSNSRISTTERGGTLFTCLVILISFLTLRSHALLNLTVLFISTTYLFSIIALLKEPHLAFHRKLIAGVGAIGALLMSILALSALIFNEYI